MIKWIITCIFQRRLKDIGQLAQDQKADKRHLKAVISDLWTLDHSLFPFASFPLLWSHIYNEHAQARSGGCTTHSTGMQAAAGTEAQAHSCYNGWPLFQSLSFKLRTWLVLQVLGM